MRLAHISLAVLAGCSGSPIGAATASTGGNGTSTAGSSGMSGASGSVVTSTASGGSGSSGSTASGSTSSGSTSSSANSSGSSTSTSGSSGSVGGPVFYIAPDGDNANPGTIDKPWLTFAHAISQLTPGATLLLEDGTYTGAVTGYPHIDCAAGAPSGTASAPIRIAAEHERQAFLKGDGSANVFYMHGCSYWIIEGIHAEDGDFPGEPGGDNGLFAFDHSDHLVLRRLLGAHNNRYFNSHIISLAYGCNDTLVEECEAYAFHRHGIAGFLDHRLTFRRNYVNGRNTPDIDGGRASGFPSNGDEGLTFYDTGQSLAENNIAENVAQGFTIHGESGARTDSGIADDNQIIGNIALTTFEGAFYLDSRCNGDGGALDVCPDNDQVVDRAAFVDDVAENGLVGFWFRGGIGNFVDRSTAIGMSRQAVLFDLPSTNAGLPSTASASATIAVDAGYYGFYSEGQTDWSFDHCDGFHDAPGDFQSATDVTAPLHVDPRFVCPVALPPGSVLATASADGGPVGAEIVYRSVGGVSTAEKLWLPDGGFPCGAVVAGVNDDPSDSCIGVGARLHIGAPGCAVP